MLAPAYPGFEVEVEALNADPSPIEALTVPAIIEHLEAVIGALDAPPILIGHSAGGVFTQILLDHGFGAAGVAINSAPTEGVAVVPLSQVKATFPVLKNPANRHQRRRLHARAVALRVHEHVQRGGVARALRALPRPRVRRRSSGAARWPTSSPATQDTWVDYHNDDRAPLLFISGSEDHLMPPTIQRSNAKHYKSDTITEIKEFEGPHLLPARAGLGGGRRLRARLGGWRTPCARAARDGVRITHIGGPTVADRGRRLAAADRPDLRPARPAATASAGGRSSRKLAGPAIAAADLGADRRGPAHATTTTATTSTPPAARCCPSAGVVVTTASGARRLGGERARARAVGRPRASRRPGRPTIEVTATPCRHGPPLSHPIVGDVDRLRAALGRPGARRAVDLGRHGALRRRARGRRPACEVGTALLHLGGVRFPVTGPLRYTMTAREAVELVRARCARDVAIPIHYEGWKHFREGRDAIERELAAAPRGRAPPHPLARARRPRRARRLTRRPPASRGAGTPTTAATLQPLPR